MLSLMMLLTLALGCAWLGAVLQPYGPLLNFAPAPARPRYVVRVEVRWVAV